MTDPNRLLDIAVAIPSIPPRGRMLARAVASVANQSLPAVAIHVAIDVDKAGAGPTRQRAIDAAFWSGTPWIAFLDDDDQMLPNHLETLALHAIETDADVVWPWFRVVGGGDPFPQHQGRQWDPADPHSFPITALVRADALSDSGVRFGRGIVDGPMAGEDLPFWTALGRTEGVKFSHVPERTWLWHHHGANTSGQPHRWP